MKNQNATCRGRTRRSIGSALFVLCVFGTRARADDVVDVCKILSDPKDIGTGIVKIRGIYSSSTEYILIGDEHCGQEFQHKGQTWRSGIWLAFPSGGRPPSKSEFDYAAFDALIKAHHDARAKGRKVSAVFEGKLKYCPQHARKKSGEETWVGCGFLGEYVFELTVTTVSDIKIQ